MPFPKPSKTVSRRVKKPKPLLFSAHQQPVQQDVGKPTKLLRERRVRVICTDPDATDSSSDEESEFAPLRQKIGGKRLVHEVCVPASPPLSICQQEEICIQGAFSANPSLSMDRQNSFKRARKEVGFLDFYERTSASNVDACVGDVLAQKANLGLSGVKEFSVMQNASFGCSGVEEFALFLSEFLAAPEYGSIPDWDEELDLLDDDMFDDVLDFEPDFDFASWVNPVQRLV